MSVDLSQAYPCFQLTYSVYKLVVRMPSAVQVERQSLSCVGCQAFIAIKEWRQFMGSISEHVKLN